VGKVKSLSLNLGILGLALLVGACDVRLNDYDYTPPAAPRGIISVAKDNKVELSWLPNNENDLSGYNIYVSDSYNGQYDLIGFAKVPHFTDHDARNGSTFYYAITAYDYDGNESEFSYENVYATPRPEGYGVALYDYKQYPNDAGYDFSTYSVGPYDDNYADFYFEYGNDGFYYMDVWDDTDIQDMGYTESLDEIIAAPAGGWSPSKDVQLITGHTYVVWTWDDHYAKFRLRDLKPSRAILDWVYQLVEGNVFLKEAHQKGVDRAPLTSQKSHGIR
jgi:hypothetical protein